MTRFTARRFVLDTGGNVAAGRDTHYTRRGIMARIIVTPDEQSDVVLLDEQVYPVHLENKLSSLQVIERLAWAVEDAEAGSGSTGRRTIRRQPTRARSLTR
jgi:hypothetical protein